MTPSLAALLLAVIAASHVPSGRTRADSAHPSRAPVAPGARAGGDVRVRPAAARCGPFTQRHQTALGGRTES